MRVSKVNFPWFSTRQSLIYTSQKSFKSKMQFAHCNKTHRQCQTIQNGNFQNQCLVFPEGCNVIYVSIQKMLSILEFFHRIRLITLNPIRIFPQSIIYKHSIYSNRFSLETTSEDKTQCISWSILEEQSISPCLKTSTLASQLGRTQSGTWASQQCIIVDDSCNALRARPFWTTLHVS